MIRRTPSAPRSASTAATRYSEGIFIGYRWFDRLGLEPLFPFGYGLSYTSFEYSDLTISRAADGGLDAHFDVRNTGTVASDEVPQLYLGAPTPAPADAQFARRALAAFERVPLAAGESKPVTLHVALRALQYWSADGHRWLTAPGRRLVYVGASSRECAVITGRVAMKSKQRRVKIMPVIHIPFSVLDSVTDRRGARAAADALRNLAGELAQAAEALGYRRFWLAEHHNMPGIASAATSIVIVRTSPPALDSIRVGSGGVMLARTMRRW